MSGTILPLAEAQAISQFVRSYPVPEGQQPVRMHCDAARVFDGVVGEGVSLKDYAACFDSMSLCMSKGVGAPMGSVIVGTKAFIARAKYYRKMFGGGTRQPGMMAAAASAALDYSLPRLAQVHALAKTTADKLQEQGYKFALPVQTNMIVLDLARVDIPGSAFVVYCARRNIVVFPNGRLVFLHQNTEDVARDLVECLTELMDDKKKGVLLSDREMNGGCS